MANTTPSNVVRKEKLVKYVVVTRHPGKYFNQTARSNIFYNLYSSIKFVLITKPDEYIMCIFVNGLIVCLGQKENHSEAQTTNNQKPTTSNIQAVM